MLVAHTLSAKDRTELERLASQLPPYTPAEYQHFMAECRRAATRVEPPLTNWVMAVSLSGLGLLRNLPLADELPPTPTTKGAVDDSPMFADRLIGLLAALFGEIVTMEGKATLRQIHNLYPADDEEFSQLGSSPEQLEWHVEDAFHPNRAKWLGLLCLRPDPDVITLVARATDLQLSRRDWIRLRTEPMRLAVDDSFAPPYRGRTFPTYPITGANGYLEIAFDPPYSCFTDDRQRQLVRRVCRAAERARCAVALGEGDFLILDNRRAIHARSAHLPRRDGTDRWIKRTLIGLPGEGSAMTAQGIVPFAGSQIEPASSSPPGEGSHQRLPL